MTYNLVSKTEDEISSFDKKRIKRGEKMEDNKFQIEVLSRLSVLETLIKDQDYKGVSEKSNKALNLANNQEVRIAKLESEVETMKKAKGMKWDKLIDYLFYVILAFALFKLGLK